MIHHMAIIKHPEWEPRDPRFRLPSAIPLISMPGMSEVISPVCKCGNNASLDISHAFVSSPAPATIWSQPAAHITRPTMIAISHRGVHTIEGRRAVHAARQARTEPLIVEMQPRRTGRSCPSWSPERHGGAARSATNLGDRIFEAVRQHDLKARFSARSPCCESVSLPFRCPSSTKCGPCGRGYIEFEVDLHENRIIHFLTRLRRRRRTSSRTGGCPGQS